MVNAMELYENFRNNQAKRALIEEQLRLSPLREETARFALTSGQARLDNDRARLGLMARQQEAAERYQQGRLGVMAQMAQNKTAMGPKAPTGYRYKPDGTMEPIPGGPADLKASAEAQKKATGQEDVGIALTTLRDAYDRLEKGGGITSTTNQPRENIAASISASAPGQMLGKVFGTQNQSARNDIAMSRPALLAALMKATGMSAKQMDSNAELKLWLQTATDPTLDVQANRRALDNIERKYISGSGKGQNPSGPRTFASEAEAAAAGLAPGTKVIINGKSGTWQ